MSKRTVKHKKKSPKKKATAASKGTGRMDVSHEKLKSILGETRKFLKEDDAELLEDAIDTLAVITNELEMKGASIRRLRKLLFGSSTEKMSNVFPDAKDGDEPDDEPSNGNDASDTSDQGGKPADKDRKKRKGHGSNKAKDYTGAGNRKINHETLKPKDGCPECLKGILYQQKEPARIVRVTGMAPLQATVYEMERLRCNLCGKVFTAKAPDGIGEEKYDHAASAMVALLKYGCGMPFNRLERLERDLGIPLPSSTQWEIAYRLAMSIVDAYTELIRQAAQGSVLHNDDTTARILELLSPPLIGKNGKERTGLFTSGILSTKEGREIAVFFTGRKHAGENLSHVLSHRNKELAAPIQMCDGIAANIVHEFETLLANCNSHARRKFVEVADDYVKEVKHILSVFKQVYKNDDDTKERNMNKDERLAYHVKHSKPLLDDLKIWFNVQLEVEKNIEPNSSLGEAIGYMTERWEKLTLFLRVPGAPLDNNICERVIKKAILHRKNAMFFKTENGAYVADLFMSLIHTCELQGVNAFEYLVALANHAHLLMQSPADWMPWNFQTTLAALNTPATK